jgi:hypothetical protein
MVGEQASKARSMAVFRCLPVLTFLVITVLLACSACAADAGVQLGSDLGVAQQVNQVQKKLHDTQEKLEASGGCFLCFLLYYHSCLEVQLATLDGIQCVCPELSYATSRVVKLLFSVHV